MIGFGVVGIFVFSVMLVQNARGIINPEAQLSNFEYRKMVDFDFYSMNWHCNRMSDCAEKKAEDRSDEVLKSQWNSYKQYSLQTAQRDSRRGVFNSSVPLILSILITMGHALLLRRS
jgi:hypothetical protein